MTEIARILVPLDLHPLGEAKLPVAATHARAFNAEIVLLHVYPSERAAGAAVSTAEAHAYAYLDAIAARWRAEGLTARPLVRCGPPAETILKEIAAQQADLVVMGSNTRHGFSRLLLGSVAEAVIAEASCPVLLVRPPVGEAPPQPAVRDFVEDARRAGPVAPRELGPRTVEVARIVGSVGRAKSLDADFRIRARRRDKDPRYRRIHALMKEGGPLPPVALYKLGYGYYILDGNHRVAAAKELGQLEIDAQVTEFVAMGDARTLRVAAERRAFERVTGLRRIGATAPGHYGRLEDLVRAYAAEHGIDDMQEAARRWEAAIYRPVADLIRARRLGRLFPGERTADVFVRAVVLREELAGSGQRPDWDAVLERLRPE